MHVSHVPSAAGGGPCDGSHTVFTTGRNRLAASTSSSSRGYGAVAAKVVLPTFECPWTSTDRARSDTSFASFLLFVPLVGVALLVVVLDEPLRCGAVIHQRPKLEELVFPDGVVGRVRVADNVVVDAVIESLACREDVVDYAVQLIPERVE